MPKQGLGGPCLRSSRAFVTLPPMSQQPPLPSFMEGAVPFSGNRKQRSYEKWHPDVRGMVDEAIDYISATGNTYTSQKVAEMITRAIEEKGITSAPVNRQTLVNYVTLERGCKWSELGR